MKVGKKEGSSVLRYCLCYRHSVGNYREREGNVMGQQNAVECLRIKRIRRETVYRGNLNVR